MGENSNDTCKILLIGESGVGKTSIISQYVEETFKEDQETSAGASFSTKKLELKNGNLVTLEIWDTAGQEKFRALTQLFYKESSAAILVYDITRKDSFEQIKEYWFNQVKEKSPNNVIIALAANKIDLFENEEVEEKIARDFANEIGAIFMMTSAKNKDGIDELFDIIANKIFKCSGDDDNGDGNTIDRIKEIRGKSVKISENKHFDNNNGKKKKGCC
jgi:small GTP-binding protein